MQGYHGKFNKIFMETNPFEFIFAAAYKDTYSEECPDVVVLPQRCSTIKSLVELYSNSEKLTNDEKTIEILHKNNINVDSDMIQDKNLIKKKIEEQIIEEMRQTKNICSLLCSMLSKDDEQCNKIRQNYQEILDQIKNLNLKINTELTSINTDDKMDTWIETAANLANEDKEKLTQVKRDKTKNCYMCSNCLYRKPQDKKMDVKSEEYPAITYAEPCHHPGLCERCLARHRSKSFYTNCKICGKSVTKLVEFNFKDPNVEANQ